MAKSDTYVNNNLVKILKNSKQNVALPGARQQRNCVVGCSWRLYPPNRLNTTWVDIVEQQSFVNLVGCVCVCVSLCICLVDLICNNSFPLDVNFANTTASNMDDTLNRSNDMSLIESILADFPAEKEKR